MAKIAQDVINEWVKRSYITQIQAVDNAIMYTSFIEQAKDGILSFCNIPLKASMPDGLFYAWVEIAYKASNSAGSSGGELVVKSLQEGDTSITFDTASAIKNDSPLIDYKAILNRFRRMP